MKKLTAISVYIRGVKYSAFAMLDAIKPVASEETLRKLFPAFNAMGRGETWSIG